LVIAEGIDTAITYRQLEICFIDEAHATKMKLNRFVFPVDFILYSNGLKKRLQPLTLEWLDQRFSNIFQRD